MRSFNLSRRSFLGGAVALTAGCRTFGTSQKVRLAAVGVMGKGFTDWLPMVKSGLAELVALCDCDYRTREEAQARLAQQGVDLDLCRIPFYTDYRRLLDDAGILGVDAMTVSTPDHVHAPVAIRAMREGIHVYVQKPLVRTLWELELFERMARENGVITQMGNQSSSLDGFRRGVEILQSGLIGDVKEVVVWTNRPVWTQGLVAAKASAGAPDPIPDGLNWDAWLATAKARFYKGPYPPSITRYDPWNITDKVYHPFSWRGFYDFGCGALGDMACHQTNLPFRGLELGRLESVECTYIEEHNNVTFPMKSTVRMTYAERKSCFRSGVRLPRVDLWWNEGNLKPSAERLPEIVAALGKIPDNGCAVFGSKGLLCSITAQGATNLLAMKGEKKARPVETHEACRAVSQMLPRRLESDASVAKGPGAPAVSADGHYVEFLNAIRGDGPVFVQTHSRCYSDIEFSVPNMEGILAGVIAQRLGGGELRWDPVGRTFGNAAADALMRPYVRTGFEF